MTILCLSEVSAIDLQVFAEIAAAGRAAAPADRHDAAADRSAGQAGPAAAIVPVIGAPA